MLVAVVALAAIAALVLPPGHDDKSVDLGDCNEGCPHKKRSASYRQRPASHDPCPFGASGDRRMGCKGQSRPQRACAPVDRGRPSGNRQGKATKY